MNKFRVGDLVRMSPKGGFVKFWAQVIGTDGKLGVVSHVIERDGSFWYEIKVTGGGTDIFDEDSLEKA